MGNPIEEWLVMGGAKHIKKSGDNFIALCPFHNDHSRSFSMNSETGQFVCFSESCGEYGSLFSFLVKACGYAYARAQELAERFGVNRPRETDEWDEIPNWADRRKKPGPKGERCLAERLLGLYYFCPEYLVSRGFQKSVLREWEVGFDVENKTVTIPVRSSNRTLVGMTRRATLPHHTFRYLHLGFSKSQYLYGLPYGKDKSTVLVGEGQLDAIALSQLGAPAAVSTMGARVSQEQIDSLSHFDKVILAFDNDQDGWLATERVGDALVIKGREVYVARSYPDDVKDPADLLQCSKKEQEKFLSDLVPYELERLDFSRISRRVRGRVQAISSGALTPQRYS